MTSFVHAGFGRMIVVAGELLAIAWTLTAAIAFSRHDAEVERQVTPMKFSIRDLLWFSVIAALTVGSLIACLKIADLEEANRQLRIQAGEDSIVHAALSEAKEAIREDACPPAHVSGTGPGFARAVTQAFSFASG